MHHCRSKAQKVIPRSQVNIPGALDHDHQQLAANPATWTGPNHVASSVLLFLSPSANHEWIERKMSLSVCIPRGIQRGAIQQSPSFRNGTKQTRVFNALYLSDLVVLFLHLCFQTRV
uniref:Predicted protein n=1 Tax=Hordeum vulgare subsp. vulgare TaxID=112509 RepID=F2CSF9_HORVV|nr:predicted protein [Hordeum vulgare subsp. vulgare]